MGKSMTAAKEISTMVRRTKKFMCVWREEKKLIILDRKF